MRAMPTLRCQPSSSFHSSEMRAWRMPLAAMRSMKSSYTDTGVISNALTLPAISRNGVRVMRSATIRTRSQGSSLSSRTHFLRWEADISSMASNPASSMVRATGSIMPVVMRSAQRLWCPSRSVVSTNRISSIYRSRQRRPTPAARNLHGKARAFP